MFTITHEIKDAIIAKYTNDKDLFLLYIDGNTVKDKHDFYNLIKNNLILPLHFIDDPTYIDNYDALADVLGDNYTYYEKNKIIIIIDSYDKFLENDFVFKNYIKEIFEFIIYRLTCENILYGSGEVVCYLAYKVIVEE